MSNPVIEVDNLGKRYRIGANKERYLSLRDELTKWAARLVRRGSPTKQEFWALQDVSFAVEQGETLGIIGRNGAGKSTLLKLLSKITYPTTGKIVRRGRVASLLEVGTGFHPELTGRENIYLNGAILGMTRREIARKFDEIVAFSEIEHFLDTPVKRYSSGMYVRLAFAVAAHLEPEVLVVDEVLAVGDVDFQKKCLGKMSDVASAGRTVLFVSHNMAAVSQLCKRGMVLADGRLVYDGGVDGALTRYTQGGMDCGGDFVFRPPPVVRQGDETACVTRVYLTGHSGQVSDLFYVGEQLTVNFDLHFFEPAPEFQMSFAVRSSLGTPIYHCVSRDEPSGLFAGSEGPVTVSATFPYNKLYPGRYVIDEIWVGTGKRKMLYFSSGAGIPFHVPDSSPHVHRPLPPHRAIIHEIPTWQAVAPASRE